MRFVFILALVVSKVLIGQVPAVPTPKCHYCGNPLPQDAASTSNPNYARIHHKPDCPYYPKSETSQSYSNQGPSKEELDAYYNRQWTDQLNQQADIEFRKGMKALQQGKCDKAARKLNMARKMVSLKIYEDAYQAALVCKGKETSVPKENQKPVLTTAPAPTNPKNPVTTSNPRERGESTTPAKDPNYVQPNYIADEQKIMESKTQSWVDYQKEQFRIRIEQPNYWCQQYYKNLLKQDSLNGNLEQQMNIKKQSELEVGDVLLVGPGDGFFSRKQAELDGWLNNNNAYVTHTLTCVKIVKGKKIFLDNQADEGPRLISEDELMKRYGQRDVSVAKMRESLWGVAQPLNDDEAQRLWIQARKMVQENKDNPKGVSTNYGLYGNNDMVCSESSWALMNAAGRYSIPFSYHIPKVSGIAFTPASFYSKQQYFIISPLRLGE
jgi:hypothetical protein